MNPYFPQYLCSFAEMGNIIKPETPSLMLNFQMEHPLCVLLSNYSCMEVLKDWSLTTGRGRGEGLAIKQEVGKSSYTPTKRDARKV